MALERTFAMIKPDAVERKNVGDIIRCIEAAPIRIVGIKMFRFGKAEVEHFYQDNKDRDFFPLLCEFMMTGPVVALVLEGEDVIARWRRMMGPTDSTQAGPETIRGKFGESIRRNAVHGSDCLEHAIFEIGCIFNDTDLI
jgi:nucleoside-diphosphate kinase